MGMFDYVKVNCSLPDKWVEPDYWEWQTKDFPDPYLQTYIIEDDGTLWINNSFAKKPNLEQLTFTGEVEFYGSNIRCSVPPNYIVTQNDEPPLSKTYKVVFYSGKIHSLKLIETDNWESFNHITEQTWLEDQRNYDLKQTKS